MNEILNQQHRSDDAETAHPEPEERLEVTFACGHTADLPTPGHASGTSYQTGTATGFCRECWNQEKLAPAVAYALEHGLPKLRGSKAQQQWAMSIRHRILLDVWPGPDGILNQRRWAAAKKLAAIPYAGWWIGHREHPAADLLSDMMPRRLDTRPTPTFRGPHGADVYFNSLR